MKKNNILLVCSDVPYPANHGGRVDVMQKLIAFKELNFDVDLVVASHDKIADEAKEKLLNYVNHIYYSKRINSVFATVISLLNMVPYQVSSRFNLKNIFINKKYDMMICESDYVMYILKNKSVKSDKKILRVHNDEAIYFHGLMKSERSLIKKIYCFVESMLFSSFKKRTKELFDSYWFISSDECHQFLDEVNNSKKTPELHWVPPHMPCKEPFDNAKFEKNELINLLFVGNLFTANNIEGIVWYLECVHSSLISKVKNIKLVIAGNARGNVPPLLTNAVNKIKQMSGRIDIVEGPSDDELKQLYKNAEIFINPMLAGAGVKLKTIDAMRNSMAVVSTSIGVEGTGLVDDLHVMIADDSEDFCDSICYLVHDTGKIKFLAKNSYDYVEKNFNMKNKLSMLTGRIDNA